MLARRIFVVVTWSAISLLAVTSVKADNPTRPFDFVHKVAPILKKHCVECHGGEESKGGFSLNTRELILDAEAATPGQPDDSLIVELIQSDDDEHQMPPKDRPRLSAKEVQTLVAWIKGGMSWESGFTFAKNRYEPPLRPRRPELPPPIAGRDNPIDRILDHYLAERDLPRPKPLSDEQFLRRLSLDLVGLPPTLEELDAFLADTEPDKRTRWIERTLQREDAYAEHWMTFWNDLLRNAYSGTGFIDGGRKQITGWLYRALRENKPYDQFVRELVAPSPESAGFIRGIKWRGDVNASQVREIQFAQTTTQVFLGINMKCASCHDSFIDRWTLEESYNLAAVYSQRPLEIHRCDKPTGKMAEAKWIFPELGKIDANAKQPERLRQMAELMTHPENGRFTRTIANRIWHRLMGRGIVHPVDAMHTEPWSADLLDALATELSEHDYDVKHLLRLIVSSQAYQSQSVLRGEAPAAGEPFVYRGPIAKRLTAEQFLDSIWQITDTWPQPDGKAFKRDGRGQGGQLAEIVGADKEARKRWGARPVRAVFTPLNALQASLGRPIREQVVTSRPAQLTTLEAIDLANGQTIADLLSRGAERLLKDDAGDERQLVERLFRETLARQPTAQERQLCLQLAGTPPTRQGVEDLLWSLLMLPEFQLVR